MLAPFDYLAPGSLAGAVAALAATPGSQPLAGGQLLLPAMKTQRAAPPQLVDLRRIGRLHGVHPAPPGQLRIGALTTLDELLEHPMLEPRWAASLVEAARASGDPQFRNRATVGGCLATRRAASHLAAALLVAEASLVLVGGTGERVVSAEQFYAAGPPGLAAGEILTEVRLPVATMTGSGYEVVADRAAGHPICG
ncbi:MAG: FAD binding domain-containing protein, partial [Natronosporangium sp.]